MALCAAAFTTQAQAQVGNLERDTINLDEVVVTSHFNRPTAVSKMNVPLRNAPLSVSTISESKMQDLDLTSLEQATRNITGIRPRNTYGGFLTFSIRGFSDFVLLNDGVRDERHNLWESAPNAGLASVDRIEVLKGAASVMFGHSALGGVINIVHKQPTSANHVNAQLGIGSWGRYRVQGGGSGAVNKWLDFRTDFSMSGGDGWRHTNDKNYNGYLALLFKISPADRLLFSVTAKNDHLGTDTGQPHFSTDIYNADGTKAYSKGDIPSFISRRTRYGDPEDHLNDKDITFLLDYTHTFGSNWTLNDHMSYYMDYLDYYATETLRYVTSTDETYDHYYMNGDTKTYIDINHIQRNGFNFGYRVNLFQNQLEMKGTVKTGTIKQDLLFGYNFSGMYAPRYRNYSRNYTGAGVNSVVDAVDPVLNQGKVFHPYSKKLLLWEYNHGIYVGDYLHLTDKFTALASVRYDRFDRTYREDDTEGKTVTKHGNKQHMHDNAFTYRFSLLYQFTKDFNLYASTSSMFKPTRTSAADGYIYIGSDGKQIHPHGTNVFKPIRGYQYEVGSHLGFSSRFTANVAAFYILKNNMVQSLGQTTDGTNISGQVGKADSKGFEIDMQAEPLYGWTIDAGYTFTEAKIKSYAKNEYAQNTQAGNYLAGAPKHMGYGWMFYEFNDRIFDGLKLGVGFNANSKTYVNAANTMEFKGYAIANAMASYQLKNWRLQLNVNNVFDKTYYTTAVSTTGYLPEEGRNFQFTATLSL